MNFNDERDKQALAWLFESADPGVRYLARRDLLRLPQDDPQLVAARREAHQSGPIAAILDRMEPDGYWARPGAGYNPKYRSAVWSLLTLAQLGARLEEDERIDRACAYLLDHALSKAGQFSQAGAPSGTIDCLQGNLIWALLELGCTDARLELALDWATRSLTGEGVAPKEDLQSELRYYAAKCGPNFACLYNGEKACAWGAVKILLALGKPPREQRTARMERAIQQGVDFLFGVDPALAAYPTRTGDRPSRNWWKFGFPVFYITDLLQLFEALAALGYRDDPRLDHVYRIIQEKQDAHGRWALEYEYSGKTWVDFGEKNQPNPWVTLRALRAGRN